MRLDLQPQLHGPPGEGCTYASGGAGNRRARCSPRLHRRSQEGGVMEPFTVVRGPAAPLMLPDINTDVISPGHAGRGDLGANAFAPLRYLPDGSDNPGFI